MNQYYQRDGAYDGEPGSNALAAALNGGLPFVQKVYALFLAGLAVSVGAGWLLFTGAGETVAIDGKQIYVTYAMAWAIQHFGLLAAAFFGIFFLSRMLRKVPVFNTVMMLAFCAVSGVFIAPRVFASTVSSGPGTVGLAGAMTVLVFGGLTAVAFVSRVDFNFLGAGLFIALLGLIGGGLLNAFVFHSPVAQYLMAWVAVVVFGGYVLYDTNAMLREPDRRDVATAALDLYLDVVNLFLSILTILDRR